MRQAAAVRTMAAMPQVEVIATGYLEAAEGDASRAMRWLVEDLLVAESERDRLRGAISTGYLRGRVESEDPCG